MPSRAAKVLTVGIMTMGVLLAGTVAAHTVPANTEPASPLNRSSVALADTGLSPLTA